MARWLTQVTFVLKIGQEISTFIPPPPPFTSQKYADLHDMEFIETSARTNMNIQEAFVKLATEICEAKSQQMPPTLPGYDHNPSLSLPRSTTLVEKNTGTCSC